MARILVIEDHPVNLELMRYLLTAFGHEVIGVGDAEAGLARARTETPDLVVCDIELPGMNGVEFVRTVRADPALGRLPLLAVTSNAMAGDRERLIVEGFDGYAAKPIDPQAFVPWMEGFLRAGNATAPVILVVDDVPVNLSLKRSCLEPMGWHILTASTPAEALSMARFNPPSLIISDVGMPEGDGFDFIREVKGVPSLANVPFIFITSTHWDDAAARKAIELGAERYLRRPMPPEQLIAEVRACLARHAASSAAPP
jgi:two-component system cell cycle response regulator